LCERHEAKKPSGKPWLRSKDNIKVVKEDGRVWIALVWIVTGTQEFMISGVDAGEL
jgi:hypothetical protein